MELTILGSGTAVASVRRAPPGYLLRIERDLVLIDAGPGTMRRVMQSGADPGQVTHMFFSHNHLDHTGELAPWLFASRLPSSPRRTPLTICGSAGFMKMLGALREVYGHWLDAATYELRLVTMDGAKRSSVRFGDWGAEAHAVSHIESSLACRITDGEGRVLAYTGDTDVCEALIPLARDADLLLIEASFPDGGKVEGHLTPMEAAQIASQAGARKTVLTHFYPACDAVDMLEQAGRHYKGEALLAEDGMRVRP